MRIVCPPFIAALIAISPLTSTAHHAQSTARAGTGAGLRPLTLDQGELPLVLSAGWSLQRFDRLMEGDDRFTEGDAGALTVQTLLLTGVARWSNGTGLRLAIPLGRIALDPPGGATSSAYGLGDVTATMEHRVWQSRGAQLHLEGGLILPTGRYAPDDVLSVTEITAINDIPVHLSTFNTQASLGAGAWSAVAGLRARWRLGERTSTGGGVRIAQPITRTSDDIRWGTDFMAAWAGAVDVLPGRLGASLTLDALHHRPDQGPELIMDNEIVVQGTAGGRTTAGIALGLNLGLTERLQCQLQGRRPVWQRVDGIQLVDGYTVGAQCSVGL